MSFRGGQESHRRRCRPVNATKLSRIFILIGQIKPAPRRRKARHPAASPRRSLSRMEPSTSSEHDVREMGRLLANGVGTSFNLRAWCEKAL